jgi:hypothetical protein
MGESVKDVESVKVVKIFEAVALRLVGGWRSGPVRALRLEGWSTEHRAWGMVKYS